MVRDALKLIVLGAAVGVSLRGCASSDGLATATVAATGSSPAPAATSPPAGEPAPGFIEQLAATRNFSLGQPRSISITPAGDAVLFLRSGPRSPVHDLYSFDVQSGRERVLLTADAILNGAEENLTAEEKARRERARQSNRGIVSYALSDDGAKILVPLSGRLFVVDRAGGQVTELASTNGYPIDPRFSPRGSMIACVRGGEVYVTEIGAADPARAERRVTSGAGGAVTNGLAEFVAQEEMSRFAGYWWSPDESMIAFQQTDTTGVETFYIADPMHPDKEPTSWPYPRPGKKNASVKLGIAALKGGEPTWVQWDRESFPYLATVRWEKNAPLTILVQNREQTHELLLAVDPATGATRTLLEEQDDAWLNIEQSCPYWLKDGSGFLWLTERSGELALELRNPDGTLKRTLTPAKFGLRGLAAVGHDERFVYVEASPEPTESDIWRLELSGDGKPIRMTGARGLYGVQTAKESGVAVWSTNGMDGVVEQRVLLADGRSAGALQSVAEQPPFKPNFEIVHLPGPLDMRAVVVRPRNFVKGKKYPVLVNVYGGPGSQTVLATERGQLLRQWYADHGFIVVSIDGRGTPGRDRAWERATKNNFIDIPLDDQVQGLRELALMVPEADTTRIGIWGWSFGGYFSAMAAMRRPDVFDAGVAGAPVCDFTDYDTHYTERYLGLPRENPSGYQACNVLTYCGQLRVPLLVIHGTADDNVYFMHSLKMTDAMFRAGRPFEFLPLSNFTHMVPDPAVKERLESRVAAFFQRHVVNAK